jgi:acyl dehydratase
MATEKLPTLSKLLFSSFRTGSKGVRIGKTDFSLTKVYDDIRIDINNIKKYDEFFDIKSPLPVPYLYLIAMRSQLAVMNDKTFPIALMGMVHLGNTIEIIDKIDMSKPLKLETSVLVPTKEEGSLFPVLNVKFFQDTKLVATCGSNYIAKRKRKTEKKAEEEPIIEQQKSTPFYTQELMFPKGIGFKYARISGDYNPIHLSSFFAKNFGFKSSIAHGWCSASRVFAIIEKQKQKELKYITVNFKTPITLPEKVKVELYNNPDGSTGFKVVNKKDEMCLEGSVS